MATFNEQSNIQSFFDNPRAIPQQFAFNTIQNIVNLPVNNPTEVNLTVQAGSTLSAFNTSVATSIDSTTVFSLSANPIISGTYRFTNTGGTAPAFRTDRGLALNGQTASISTNTNGSVTFSIVAGSLAALQVGDSLFIPGLSTGDATGPFNPSNEGLWTVTSTGTLSVTLVRPGTFSAYSQAGVVITSNSQVLGYSSTGVQIGNLVDILSGFNAYTTGTYTVSQVTPGWVEVQSAQALPPQTGIMPGASGMNFYSGAKRWIRVQVNQSAALQLNGDTTIDTRLDPIVIQDGSQYAFMEKIGSVFSLSIVNRSLYSMAVRIMSFE